MKRMATCTPPGRSSHTSCGSLTLTRIASQATVRHSGTLRRLGPAATTTPPHTSAAPPPGCPPGWSTTTLRAEAAAAAPGSDSSSDTVSSSAARMARPLWSLRTFLHERGRPSQPLGDGLGDLLFGRLGLLRRLLGADQLLRLALGRDGHDVPGEAEAPHQRDQAGRDVELPPLEAMLGRAGERV